MDKTKDKGVPEKFKVYSVPFKVLTLTSQNMLKIGLELKEQETCLKYIISDILEDGQLLIRSDSGNYKLISNKCLNFSCIRDIVLYEDVQEYCNYTVQTEIDFNSDTNINDK